MMDPLQRQTSGPALPFTPTLRAYPAQIANVGISGQSIGTSQGTFSASWTVAEPGMSIRPMSPALPFTPIIRGHTSAVGSDVAVSISGQTLSVVQGTFVSFQIVLSNINTAQMGPMFDFSSTPRGYTTPIGNVSVALSGQSLAMALGAMTSALSVPVTGQNAVSSQGSMSARLSVPIAGTALSMSQGSFTTIASGDISVFLTGLTMTVALGTLGGIAGHGIIMPNVVGLNFYQALEELQNAGIYVPVPVISFVDSSISVAYTDNSRYAPGFVAAQSVVAGDSVQPGARITLTVELPRFGMVIDMPPDWRQ